MSLKDISPSNLPLTTDDLSPWNQFEPLVFAIQQKNQKSDLIKKRIGDLDSELHDRSESLVRDLESTRDRMSEVARSDIFWLLAKAHKGWESELSRIRAQALIENRSDVISGVDMATGELRGLKYKAVFNIFQSIVILLVIVFCVFRAFA